VLFSKQTNCLPQYQCDGTAEKLKENTKPARSTPGGGCGRFIKKNILCFLQDYQ